MTRRRKRSPLFQRFIGSRKRGAPKRANRSQRGLIGRDLAAMHREAAGRRRWLPLLVGGLLAALCLTALRIDLIRQRYDLAAAMGEEKRLLEERRQLTARVRSLRDPALLAVRAQHLGFERPAHVRLLDAPEVALGPRP
jgi:hypothetical protein